MVENSIAVDILMRLINAQKVKAGITGVTTAIVKNTKASEKNNVVKQKTTIIDAKLANAAMRQRDGMKKTEKIYISQTRRVESLERSLKKLYGLQARGIVLNRQSSRVLANTEMHYTRMGGNAKALAAQQHALDASTGGLLTKFTKFRWMLVNVAMAAGALYGVYRLLVQPTIEMESAMADVRKTTNFSRAEIKELTKEMVSLSKILPISATELAKIATVAGQLGIGQKGSGAIKQFTTVAAMMSTATEMTAEDAAKSLAKITQTFNMPISSVNNLGSVINELSNTTAATSTEIASSLSRVGAAAANLDLSADFVAAFQATLISAGMRAERAGTRMRSALTMVTSNLPAFQNLMDDTGMKVSNFADIMENDAQQGLLLVLQALNSYDRNTERAKKTTELFGRAGGFAIQTLANNYDELVTNLKTSNDEMANGLSLIRETAIQSETIAGQWQQIANRFKSGVIGTEGGMFADFTEGIAQLQMLGTEDAFKFLRSPIFGVVGAAAKMRIKVSEAREEFVKFAEESGKSRKEINQMLADIDARPTLTNMINQMDRYRESIVDSSEAAGKLGDNLAEVLKSFTFVEDFQEAIDSIGGKGPSSIQDFVSSFESFLNLESKFSIMSNKVKSFFQLVKENEATDMFVEDFGFTESTMLSWINDQEVLNNRIEQFSKEQEIASREVKYWKSVISESKNSLAEYNSALKDTNSEISKLAKARFTGQTDVEELISGAERFMKKQELATYGITDAQSFLQNALRQSAGGYDNLLDSITQVNLAVDDGINSYDAWKETISQFVRDAIIQGNDLGENVSQTVGQFQTLLLSSSKFTEETDNQGNAISLLRDAYDVHYGAMEDDVKFAMQRHEEATNGVFSTSQKVISALQAQWIEQSRWSQAVSDTENRIAELSEGLKAAESNYNFYQTLVDSLRLEMKDLESQTRETIAAIQELDMLMALRGGGGESVQNLIDLQNANRTTYVPNTQIPYAKALDLLDPTTPSIDFGVDYGSMNSPITVNINAGVVAEPDILQDLILEAINKR